MLWHESETLRRRRIERKALRDGVMRREEKEERKRRRKDEKRRVKEVAADVQETQMRPGSGTKQSDVEPWRQEKCIDRPSSRGRQPELPSPRIARPTVPKVPRSSSRNRPVREVKALQESVVDQDAQMREVYEPKLAEAEPWRHEQLREEMSKPFEIERQQQ